MEYTIGDNVLAIFTNNNEVIRFLGEVTKVNRNTYRVKSQEDDVNGWDRGHEFVVQSELSPLHSMNNRIVKKLI